MPPRGPPTLAPLGGAMTGRGAVVGCAIVGRGAGADLPGVPAGCGVWAGAKLDLLID